MTSILILNCTVPLELAINVQNYSLRESCTLGVKCSTYSPEGRICNVLESEH